MLPTPEEEKQTNKNNKQSKPKTSDNNYRFDFEFCPEIIYHLCVFCFYITKKVKTEKKYGGGMLRPLVLRQGSISRNVGCCTLSEHIFPL